MEEKKLWYALIRDENDHDWGTGTFDKSEALEIARRRGYKYIDVIDANYDEEGNPTTDGECVEVIEVTAEEEE